MYNGYLHRQRTTSSNLSLCRTTSNCFLLLALALISGLTVKRMKNNKSFYRNRTAKQWYAIYFEPSFSAFDDCKYIVSRDWCVGTPRVGLRKRQSLRTGWKQPAAVGYSVRLQRNYVISGQVGWLPWLMSHSIPAKGTTCFQNCGTYAITLADWARIFRIQDLRPIPF